MSRLPRHSRLLIAAGVLAVAGVVAPQITEDAPPDWARSAGAAYDGAFAPVAQSSPSFSPQPKAASPASPRRGEVTAAMRREIERVVAAGASQPVLARMTTRSLVDTQVRCAVFSGQRYCLGVGWTEASEEDVRARLAATATSAQRRTARPTTGDLGVVAALRTRAARDEEQRVRAETRELTDAAASVAKVWLLRHEVQGVPLPDGFFDDHPEAAAGIRTGEAAAGTSAVDARAQAKPRDHGRRYPRRAKIMRSTRTIEQNRSWWCGPAALQTIAWNWRHEKQPQSHWARKLGTTTEGSAISEIVRLVNRKTGYDSPGRAGPYVVLDISDFTYRQWWRMTKRHIARLRAPLVLHPQLLQRYYPYLGFDASGHFQVGRGYRDRRSGVEQLGFFEPWNQQAFDPGSPYVERVQWRSAYRSFRAHQAHPMQNIGL